MRLRSGIHGPRHESTPRVDAPAPRRPQSATPGLCGNPGGFHQLGAMHQPSPMRQRLHRACLEVEVVETEAALETAVVDVDVVEVDVVVEVVEAVGMSDGTSLLKARRTTRCCIFKLV